MLRFHPSSDETEQGPYVRAPPNMEWDIALGKFGGNEQVLWRSNTLTGPHVVFNSCHDDDSFVSTGSLSSCVMCHACHTIQYILVREGSEKGIYIMMFC